MLTRTLLFPQKKHRIVWEDSYFESHKKKYFEIQFMKLEDTFLWYLRFIVRFGLCFVK